MLVKVFGEGINTVFETHVYRLGDKIYLQSTKKGPIGLKVMGVLVRLVLLVGHQVDGTLGHPLHHSVHEYQVRRRCQYGGGGDP